MRKTVAKVQIARGSPALLTTARPGRRAAWLRRLPLYAVVILGAVVMLYPLLWLLSSSFKAEDRIFSQAATLWPGSLELSNYTTGWTLLESPFGVYILNSAIVASFAVVGNIVSCSLVAYAFARLRFYLRRFWFALMLGTLMLPYHVTMIPQYVLFHHLGWVGTYLPLIVPHFLATDAFFVFLIVQFTRSIPRELDDAGTVDGCGAARLYWYIILPLVRPALVTTAILSFIWSWDEFLSPLVYLDRASTYTVPLALNLFLNDSGQSLWGPMFAMSILSLLPVVVCFLVFQKRIVEGIATSGLKG